MSNEHTSSITPADLTALPVFEGLGEEVGRWLVAHGEVVDLAAQEKLFEEDDPADAMIVVLEGALQFLVNLGGQVIPAATHRRGAVTGLLPFSRMTHYGGVTLATEPTRVLMIRREHFDEMLRVSVELGQRLVGIMSDRVREATKYSQQRERMTALGKLAAGLAHELNNPAAAVRRATASLRERLDAMPTLVARMAAHDLTEAQVCAVDRLRERSRGREPELSTLERGEREDEMAGWLEEHGLAKSWLLAETFVSAGIGREDLQAVAGDVPAAALPEVVAWLEASVAADRLAAEIDAASKRISELVASVKMYSHMDRAPDKQPVDVRQGLDSTVTMLGHKIRKKGIRLERDLPADLPQVQGFPGELNQVWTNLIDNAVDAMEAGGVLRIEAGREGACVFIRIIDSGHGIAPEVQARIFEPFFTTKGVGEGTGLGLDLVQRIIKQQHGGDIRVESRPGHTVFEIQLPA